MTHIGDRLIVEAGGEVNTHARIGEGSGTRIGLIRSRLNIALVTRCDLQSSGLRDGSNHLPVARETDGVEQGLFGLASGVKILVAQLDFLCGTRSIRDRGVEGCQNGCATVKRAFQGIACPVHANMQVVEALRGEVAPRHNKSECHTNQEVDSFRHRRASPFLLHARRFGGVEHVTLVPSATVS